MYVCMYVHEYMYRYLCAWHAGSLGTHTCMHTYTNVDIYIYIHTHAYTHTYISINTYIHTYTHIYMHRYLCAWHAGILGTYKCMRTYTKLTYIHTYIYIHTYTHIHKYKHIHTCVYTYIHAQVSMRVACRKFRHKWCEWDSHGYKACMYVCMHVCVCM